MPRMVLTDTAYHKPQGETRRTAEVTHGWLAHLSASPDLPYPMSKNGVTEWPVTTACGKVLEARGTWTMLDGLGSSTLAHDAGWVICLDCVMALLR